MVAFNTLDARNTTMCKLAAACDSEYDPDSLREDATSVIDRKLRLDDGNVFVLPALI